MSQYVEKLSLNIRQDQRYEKVITEYLEDIKSDEVIDSLITLFKSRLDNLLATVALQSEEISNLKKRNL